MFDTVKIIPIISDPNMGRQKACNLVRLSKFSLLGINNLVTKSITSRNSIIINDVITPVITERILSRGNAFASPNLA